MKITSAFNHHTLLFVLFIFMTYEINAQLLNNNPNKYSTRISRIHPVTVKPWWNLLALPLVVTDGNKILLFPTATSSAFIYQSSYVSKETLHNGYGFWLKFDSAETIQVEGKLNIVDTIEVSKGWNIIGALSLPVLCGSIQSIPADIILSDYFSYSEDGYQNSDTLLPGSGYWVKVSQDGRLIMRALYTNYPPNPPSNPDPADHSMDVDTNITLSWMCSDPEGDPLTYDVYLGIYNPPTIKVSSSQSDTYIVRSGLGQITTYYWKVVARDDFGDSTVSPVWRFTTFLNSCPGETTVVYEGKTYHTVQIGTQCWLRENLDVGVRINGNQSMSDNGTIEKYCYDDNPSNCDKYGGLYQWNEAMRYTTAPGVEGICPPGWHIPTLIEFQTLSNNVSGDGKALRVVREYSGGGTNTSGFSALLTGFRYNDSHFYELLYFDYSWSSTERTANTAYNLYLIYNSSLLLISNYFTKDYGFNIRCLKD